MGAFQRLYAFLSQIFDYGNTAIEKRFIFYRRLLPLLEFGREREGIDLSKVVLTHHQSEEPRQAEVGAGERRISQTDPAHRSWQRLGAGKREGSTWPRSSPRSTTCLRAN